MNQKQRHNLTLSEASISYIEAYQDEHHIRYPGDAVDQIILEHERSESADRSQEYLMGLMADRFQKLFAEEMKRLRLAANRSDKNTQVVLELMNGLLMDQNVESCITTSILESQPMKDAKEAVEERISNQRQKKISAEESQAASS